MAIPQKMNFEELSSDILAKELRCFYAEAWTKNGNQYSKSTLVSIGAGINRHLTSSHYSRTITIMKDKDSVSSDHVLMEMIKSLKREGADKTKYHLTISYGDITKTYQLKATHFSFIKKKTAARILNYLQ